MNNKRFFVFVVSLVLVALPLAPAYAAVFQVGQSVAIPKDKIEADNLYLAGGQVTVSTTAQKDLVAAGGNVIVDGPVWGDVLVAGGNVSVLGDVRGDVRVAAGQVVISGKVTGDVIAAGGGVTILQGSVIAGDVLAEGGKVDIEGTVSGEAHLYGGAVTINGPIASAVQIKAGKSVTFGERAILAGPVEYSAPAEATVVSGAKVPDTVTFTKSGVDPNKFKFALGAGLFAI